MIYIKCLDSSITKWIKTIGAYSLVMVEPYIYCLEEDIDLSFFLFNVFTEKNVLSAGIIADHYDPFIKTLLDFLYNKQKNECLLASDILLQALASNDRLILIRGQQFLKKIARMDQQRADIYVACNGNISLCCKRMYMHRNSIGNWLNKFESLYQFNLRTVDNWMVYKILKKFIEYYA